MSSVAVSNRWVGSGSVAGSHFEEKDHLAALEELQSALLYLDVGIVPPLLALTPSAAEKAEKLLSRSAPPIRQKYLISAWVVAVLQRLQQEGMSPAAALKQVARAVRCSESTIEKWKQEFAKDSAPFEPLPHDAHLQRISFHVRLCAGHATENKLSGKQMLEMLKSNPAQVHRLSARRPIKGP